MRPSIPVSLLVLCGLCVACSQPVTTRDWNVSPAIVEQEMVSPLYAVSDIHGGYDRLVALLLKH
jgi:hypothetical protein